MTIAAVAGCHATDKLFCDKNGCAWTDAEWARIQTLSPLPKPPVDLSNAYESVDEVAALGKAFYFDPKFSGAATLVDSINRPVAAARAAKGSAINISCATCHDPMHAGTDVSSVPNTLSIGAGIYDVNGQQTLNAAFYPLLYWNGRSDSLWSQALAVNESGFSMNSTRLQDFWVIVDNYADAYNAVFPTALPAAPTTTDFPLNGKPGSDSSCDPSSKTEPFSDAFDCMTAANKAIVNRVFVNFGKAIAAYEHTLSSRNSPFDRFVEQGPGSGWISPAAERGARLFVGKASCIDCHNTPLFSDTKFHDIGVPQAGDHVPTVEACATGTNCNCSPDTNLSTCEPAGAWSGTFKLLSGKFQKTSEWSDDPYAAEPCATTEVGVTPDCPAPPVASPTLKGAWRTPSLRDVALTAPYMHDGYYQTLTDVVQHYNHGGVAGAGNTFTLPLCSGDDAGPDCAVSAAADPGLAVQIKPLDLTDDEVADLVAFLETLTGQSAGLDAGTSVDAHPAPDAHPPADAPADGHASMDGQPRGDGSPGQ
ncbi:MAG TPA: cytochrome c peroxidase [Polyangia bacterium]|nr:cytochrome c peroxidase [Polyangia bacterium]